MTAPPVSVIVVSRHRPRALARCLLGLSQLDYPAVEVVVVADPSGLAVSRNYPVKRVAFDDANISAARNAGISAASGQIVAFIDDDAVPEPQWLRHLIAPFSDPAVSASGGYVVGANGISMQWTSGTVDRLLRIGPLDLTDDGPGLHRARPGKAIEIKGVNCAYRRDLLLDMGGFDPELRYYLDETELNLRLAAKGAVTAIVPQARVHHRKEQSALRRADGVPLDLATIGASAAVTLRRHGADATEIAAAAHRLFDQERTKLERLRTTRRLSARQVAELMSGLSDGFAEGARRILPPLLPLVDTAQPLLPLHCPPRPLSVLSGRIWQRARLTREAKARVGAGEVVRVFVFSPTTLFHQHCFTDQGYWLQTGGLFGKSDRTDPVFRLWSLAARVRRESDRSLSCFRYS